MADIEQSFIRTNVLLGQDSWGTLKESKIIVVERCNFGKTSFIDKDRKSSETD